MKIFLKIISIISSLIIGCVIMLGCNSSLPKEPIKPTEKPTYNDTEFDLISNGTCKFTIVYPNEEYAGTKIKTAATKLKQYIFEATGCELPIKSDAEYSQDTKMISLGKTAQAKSNLSLQASVSTANLGYDGYIISTESDAIYLLGGSNSGTLYASQEFLKIYFNYEYYAKDCYSLNKNIKNLKLKDVQLIDVPDFESRTPTSCMHYIDDYRCVPYTAKFNSADGNFFVHNYFGTTFKGLLPKNKYQADHPKWYDTTGTQLCLEAYGDSAERLAMKDAVVAEMIYRLELQPDIDWISFSHNDGGLWCACNACKAIAEQYNGESGAFVSVINFVNLVAADIKAWNLQKCPERDITIFIFDYGKVNKPPVKTDESGKPLIDKDGNYIPLSPELMLADNVAVFFCFSMNSTGSSVDDMLSSSAQDEAKRLKAVMKDPKFYLWSYSACYNDYLLPYEKLSWIKNQYIFGKSIGAVGFFDQGRYNGEENSDWERLCGYVSSKLLWNTELEVEDLVMDFFKNYFLDASAEMYDLYKDYRAHMGWLKSEQVLGQSTISEKYWPYKTLSNMLDKIDKAYLAISKYKNQDLNLYNTLSDRIKLEGITYRYLQIMIYPQYYSINTFYNMKKTFLDDCHNLSIVRISEFDEIDNLFLL